MGGVLNKRLVQNDPHTELHSQRKRQRSSSGQLRNTVITSESGGGRGQKGGELGELGCRQISRALISREPREFVMNRDCHS